MIKTDFLDLMTSSWDMQTNVQFFRNSKNGRFEERSSEVGLATIPGGLNMLQTDYNNDGRPDVLILRGGWLGLYGKIPNTLLRNNGVDEKENISFTGVTDGSGLVGAYPTQTAVWSDFNNDGWLALFIGNESAVKGFPFPSQIFLNSQDGTLTEVAKEANVQLYGFAFQTAIHH